MDVWIRSSRVRSLLTSAIEVYNRETDGVFSGKFVLRKIRGRKKTVLYVENAYPLQTAERMPSQVSHGNISAFRRVMHSLASSRVEFLGGYHSHPFPYKLARPSKGDVSFIKDELDFLRRSKKFKTQDKWLEIIVCIKKREFERVQKIGWKLRKQGKKIRFSLTITPLARYEILLGAYWIDFSGKRPGVEEARIHIPWQKQ